METELFCNQSHGATDTAKNIERSRHGQWYEQEIFQERIKATGLGRRILQLFTVPRDRRACLR
jgi:hypothetical protein